MKKQGTQEEEILEAGVHDLNSHDPLQTSTSKPVPELGNISPSPSQSHDNFDLPIAQKKGVRTCSQHPMSNFKSYHALSPSF